ncbi:MAG: hypothetical protein NWF07_15260 [Candidatus Bathyarchaeota archaeon]|nr:hypothetical protein [Candidatus Bathyarchaeota archaeon]
MSEIAFKLLEIDLTTKTSKVVDVTEDVKIYSAGTGLGNKLLWDRVPQETGSFDPEQILHFGVGPLTGLCGGQCALSFISPLTGWKSGATSGGYFGAEIADAGYNTGILITGKASNPVYIYIYDDQVEIRDASDLWGLNSTKTNARLQEKLYQETGEIFRTAVISAAGENLVRYANIIFDGIHSAGKRGPGAIMGSKNLKAMVVRGTIGATYADHQKVWALQKSYVTNPKNALTSIQYFGKHYGINNWTSTYLSNPSTLGDFKYGSIMTGVKNNHSFWDPICDNYNYNDYMMKYRLWHHACPGCIIGCYVSSFDNNPTLGATVCKHLYDNSGGCSANWMLKTYEEQSVVSAALEELGMDGEELGGVVAWAMDLYEHGIITQEDLGGIDLKWGDLDAALALMKKIAYREDKAPNALADGFRRAEQVFGEESIWYAYEVHGCAMDTQEMRSGTNRFRYTASAQGARKHGEPRDFNSSLTQCSYHAGMLSNSFGSINEGTRQLLNAACGWNLTIKDVEDMYWRFFYFSRAVSHRAGYNVPLGKDDIIPVRAYTETITDKYGTKYMVDEPYWREVEFPDYLENSCKLNRDGSLPKSELERLGLGFVIPELDPSVVR